MEDLPGINFVELNDFVPSTFLGEEDVKDERKGKLWNPIFNHIVELKDRRERGIRIGRYFLTKALLVDHMEVVADVKYAKAWAALNVCLGWIDVAFPLEDWSAKFLCPPKHWS